MSRTKRHRTWRKRLREQREALTRERYNYSALYNNNKAYECAYCGANADTKDHVIPVLAMEYMVKFKIFEIESEIVPCCRECNSLAGSKLFSSFQKKKEYIQTRIYERYSKIIPWTEEEIEEADLLGNLKKKVMVSNSERLYHKARWKYQNLDYVGEIHNPLNEGHFKDILKKEFLYEEEAKKLFQKAKRREEMQSRKLKKGVQYIFGKTKAAMFCEISVNELNRHLRRDNLKFLRDQSNRYAFELEDLNGFKNDIECLRQEMD